MRFDDEFGYYELNPFPGCNQMVVSNHAFIKKIARGNGFGQIQHLARLKQAAKLGYDYIICTVKANNAAEIHILEKNNWHHLTTFFNNETEHLVRIYGRILSDL